jgi:hypothetical protein
MSGQLFATLWFVLSLISLFLHALEANGFIDFLLKIIRAIITWGFLLLLVKLIIAAFTWALS